MKNTSVIFFIYKKIETAKAKPDQKYERDTDTKENQQHAFDLAEKNTHMDKFEENDIEFDNINIDKQDGADYLKDIYKKNTGV